MKSGIDRMRQLYRPRILTVAALTLSAGGIILLLVLQDTRTGLLATAAGVLLTSAIALVETWRTRQSLRRVTNRLERLRRQTHRIETQRSPLKQAPPDTPRLIAQTKAEIERAHDADLRPAEVLSIVIWATSADPDTLPWDIRRKLVLSILHKSPVQAAKLIEWTAERLDLPEKVLSALARALWKRGYLADAELFARACVNKVGTDAAIRELKKIRSEAAFLRGEIPTTYHVEHRTLDPIANRVLHVVGRSLPHTQSGYTVRTHEIAKAQILAGLDVHVVTQMGYGVSDSQEYSRDVVDGVTYHRLPGAPRGTVGADDWLGRNITRLATLARTLRPGILHAASDFVNPLAALAVGRAYGIPVIYETRGFWEETWMSRMTDRYGWPDRDQLEDRYGLPEAYTWRKATEERIRREAATVVTLSDGMADKIIASGVAPERVRVVPNAVDVDAFPLQSRDQELAKSLGIDPDEVVVGYITSLVEYEGVDRLVEAFSEARKQSQRRLRLLIVGDGPVKANLEDLAATLGLTDAIFTGVVPHSDVLRYYGLIDIFVVPRKPVEVCHLVTPLKPFEAFATGRAVVMSDVRALASIAHDSQAARTFAAGSTEALALELVKLADNETHRLDLGRRSREWVVNNRTWRHAAHRYVELYGELGVVPFTTDSQKTPEDERPESEHPYGHDRPVFPAPDTLRQFISEDLELPYERLHGPVDRSDRVDEIMEVGWHRPPYDLLPISEDTDWIGACRTNRTWAFLFHSWEFIGPALAKFEESADSQYLSWATTVAASWCRTFLEHSGEGTMAWYDMALGARIARLSYLVEQALRHNPDSADLPVLIESLALHFEKISLPEAFTTRTNHGLYVAIGQIAAARRWVGISTVSEVLDQGRERLAIMVEQQFAEDGGHVEHSPDYHRMVLNTLEDAARYGLVRDESIAGLLSRAREVLGWFVQPNDHLAQVGDTRHRRVQRDRGGPAQRRDSGEESQYGLKILPKTGYAIVRHGSASGLPEEDSYLLMQAGFHSRAHKHADDLSLVWYDQGREVLIDAGRYGYIDLLPAGSPDRLKGFFYSAPERQYVESTIAHNTLALDGHDHERRNRPPYGSAIRECLARGGMYFVSGEVDHGVWTHHRRVVLNPGAWLLVRDEVSMSDDEPHTVRLWWNFPERTIVQEQTGEPRGYEDAAEEGIKYHVRGARLIDAVEGSRSPLRGWRSMLDMEFTPALSVGFEHVGTSGKHEIETTLLLPGQAPGEVDLNHPFATEMGD